jgi:integrase
MKCISCAPKTVNNVLTVLNVMLMTAVGWKLIEQLPCSIGLLPVAPREAAFHDFGAYERLLEAARSIDGRTYLIALMGGEGGLRVGEIVALEWGDFDLEHRRISIRHSDWRGQLTAPENGRIRFVGMTERLAAAIRQQRHHRSRRVLCKTTERRSLGRVRGHVFATRPSGRRCRPGFTSCVTRSARTW